MLHNCHHWAVNEQFFWLREGVERNKLVIYCAILKKSYCFLKRWPLWVIWFTTVLFNNSKPKFNSFNWIARFCKGKDLKLRTSDKNTGWWRKALGPSFNDKWIAIEIYSIDIFLQDGGDIICPECAKKKMMEEMDNEWVISCSMWEIHETQKCFANPQRKKKFACTILPARKCRQVLKYLYVLYTVCWKITRAICVYVYCVVIV